MLILPFNTMRMLNGSYMLIMPATPIDGVEACIKWEEPLTVTEDQFFIQIGAMDILSFLGG